MDRTHPDLTFSLLPWVLESWPEARPLEIFYTGTALMAARYEELGLCRLLPTDRVWVGVRSSQPAFGGFHYPGQGYRHLQMGAVITRYGDLAHPGVAPAELVAVDLLRSYAHDCLHYGTYRSYRLQGHDILRVQYGINFRRADGRTYSRPDPAESPATRNLGVVMEGATDREAKTVVRAACQASGLGQPTSGMDRYQFRDATGMLDAADLEFLDDADARAATGQTSGSDLFLQGMASYARAVGARYAAFLREVGGASPGELHAEILRCMISGRLGPLCRWLGGHGRTFKELFKSPDY